MLEELAVKSAKPEPQVRAVVVVVDLEQLQQVPLLQEELDRLIMYLIVVTELAQEVEVRDQPEPQGVAREVLEAHMAAAVVDLAAELLEELVVSEVKESS